MKAALRTGIATATAAAVLAIGPTRAGATTGQDSTCSQYEYCISEASNTEGAGGSGSTSMANGWTTGRLDPQVIVLSDYKFQDGNLVGANSFSPGNGNVTSIRNRETIYQYTMCIYGDGTDFPTLKRQAFYSSDYWLNLSSANKKISWVFARTTNQGSCPSTIDMSSPD